MDKNDLKEIKEVVKSVVNKEIDRFAVIVAQGFAGVDKRFDGIDSKLAEHDKKFAEHDKKFAEHDGRFERIESKLDYQNQKMDEHYRQLSDKIDGIGLMLSGDMKPVYEDIDNLKRRVTKLEKARA